MQPVPVSALDTRFDHRRDRMVRWLSAIAVIAVIIGTLIFLVVLTLSQQRQIGAQQQIITVQQREISASCGIWETIGDIPPTVPKGGAAPGLEGLTLIVEGRNTYIGEGCGKLPAPSHALIQWAAYYRLPVKS